MIFTDEERKIILSAFDLIQTRVTGWADRVYPHRTPQSVFDKFWEEILEITKDPGDLHEHADLFILVLDLAYQVGKTGGDSGLALIEKIEINEKREWKINSKGVMSHV
jgi:hypothetical protein